MAKLNDVLKCQAADCEEFASTRIRLRSQGSLIDFYDVCDFHRDNVVAVVKEFDPTVEQAYGGYVTVDEDGNEVNTTGTLN